MKTKIIAIPVAVALSSAGTYLALDHQNQSKVMEVQAEVTSMKDQLLGYTKYTDYISAGKQVVTAQAKFLAVKVVQDYDLVEHLEAGKFGLTSRASVVVNYSVEYSFGFDLKPDSFEIRPTPAGMEVRIGKPILVASPAVKPLKHEVMSMGLLTDERTAVIHIQQRLPAIALAKGQAMALEEPVSAACEKKLVEFLRDFLSKQPGVKQVPTITVAYK